MMLAGGVQAQAAATGDSKGISQMNPIRTLRIYGVHSVPGMPNMLAVHLGQSFQGNDPSVRISYSKRTSGNSLRWTSTPNTNRLNGSALLVTQRSAGDGENLRFLSGDMGPTLIRSGDNGQSWAEVSFAPELCADIAPPGSPTQYFADPYWISLATSPASPQILFASRACVSELGFAGVLYASLDRGISWQRRRVLTVHPLTSTHPFGIYIAPSPTNQGHWFTLGNSTGLTMTEMVIGETTDFGQTWTTSTTSLPSRMGVISFVAGAAARTLYVIVGTTDTIKAFTSTDGGEIWNEWKLPSACTSGSPKLSRITGVADQMIYQCEPGITYRTRDGGASWQRLNFPSDENLPVRTDLANAGRLYAYSEHHVWASNDEGDTWFLYWSEAIEKGYVFVPLIRRGE